MRHVLYPNSDRILYRIENEVPLPEGLTFGIVYKGKAGKEASPSVFTSDDRIIGRVRPIKYGYNKGMYAVHIFLPYDDPRQRAGSSGTVYFYDPHRAIQFLKVAVPEAYRP